MKLSTHLRRSAIDATRFTATSPHAYSKPTPVLRSAASSHPSPPQAHRFAPPENVSFKRPPPTGPSGGTPVESPAEKVSRLRAARIAEREAQVTNWDRIVVRGRSWADRAHKVTVYSLVTFSVVASAITAFALTDMILHNRRKRSAFYAEQRSLYATRLLDAIETEKSGRPLDEDQILILNRERARVQAEEAAKERTWGKRVKGLVFGAGGVREEGTEQEGVMSEGEVLERMGVGMEKILEKAESGDGVGDGVGEGVLRVVGEEKGIVGSGLEARGATGGPLDQAAEEVVEKMKSKGGWINWGR